MPRVCLIWPDWPPLAGLDPAQVAERAGVGLYAKGDIEAAVVAQPREAASRDLLRLVAGKPVAWLDLPGLVGGGEPEHRLNRAGALVAGGAARAALGILPPVYTKKAALNVLIWGAGAAALAAAREVAALGHPVVLATPLADLAACGADEDAAEVDRLMAGLPRGLEARFDTHLVRLTGGAGDFRAWLKEPKGEQEERYGAVILAPAGELAQEAGALGLDPDLVRTAQGLEAEGVAGPEGGWLMAAVLAGVNRPAGAWAFDQAVRAARALQDRPRVQAHLIFSEARVASEGGERRYRQAREAGVLAARVSPGGLGVSGQGRELAWDDAVLGEPLELAPDLVATCGEPVAEPPECLGNELLWPPRERLLPEHPRISGGRTAISGLYLLGAVRGTPPGPERIIEAQAAAAELHHRLIGAHGVPAPVVNTDRCADCLTCVRTCPHGVPRHVEGKIQPAPAGCVGCGICAAECPAEAITPVGWGNPELCAFLEAALAQAPEPKAALFACGQSAWPAFRALSQKGHQWPAGLVVLPVPCAGRVGQYLTLKALSLGAGRVLVAGCHPGNCRSITGNLRSIKAAAAASDLLEATGWGAERVRFLAMASNQPGALVRAVAELLDGEG